MHSDIYDDFVKLSAEKAKSRVVGDPFDDKTQQGPQVDKDQFEKILHYINLGKEQGARLCTGADSSILPAPVSFHGYQAQSQGAEGAAKLENLQDPAS